MVALRSLFGDPYRLGGGEAALGSIFVGTFLLLDKIRMDSYARLCSIRVVDFAHRNIQRSDLALNLEPPQPLRFESSQDIRVLNRSLGFDITCLVEKMYFNKTQDEESERRSAGSFSSPQ